MALAEVVRQFIRAELLWDNADEVLSDDLPLLELGIVDSIGMLRLMAHLERHYAVDLAGAGFSPRDFATVASIVTFARSRGVQDDEPSGLV